MDVKARNKEVKKRLSKIFGSENVSVRNGRGTAWGWCHIDINAKSPKCEKGFIFTCYDCSEFQCSTRREETQRIRDKVDQAIKDIEFYSYCDDMNYDHKELIVQIDFRKLAQPVKSEVINRVDKVLSQILS